MKMIAGVDVGGTFTDAVVWNSELGRLELNKVLTTPTDPRIGVIESLGSVRDALSVLIHGTTVVTNALIERHGAKVGMITTNGYRDVIEVGNELRYDSFDLTLKRPTPLVPRELRIGVGERTSSTGEIVERVDEKAVREAVGYLLEHNVEAVAICFLNSYANSFNEQLAGQIARAGDRFIGVTCSSEVAAEIREFPRFSTAVANAFVQPLTMSYLERLEEQLGLPVLIVLSDGGVTSSKDAARRPIAMLESGPAAGVMMTSSLQRHLGWDRILSFDMGGTTAKIGLIHEGIPNRIHEFEVARVHRFKKGSGLPIRTSVVDLIEIGAGGGSIGWVSALGLLEVGPHSAGAEPGPACYGRGGMKATVTDADVILGYIDPNKFLGGRMPLDVGASQRVLANLGTDLQLGLVEAAAGILEVVLTNMANAAKMHIAERGGDPALYHMVAFGGAGPVHAYDLARKLGIRKVLYPMGAGVASAVGMLVAPRTVERSQSMVGILETLDWRKVRSIIGSLKDEGLSVLEESGVNHGDVTFELSVEMRYSGQGSEFEVNISDAIVSMNDAEARALLETQFREVYTQQFGSYLKGFPTEVISWRVRAIAPPVVADAAFARALKPLETNNCTEREVYFVECGRFVTCKVFSRESVGKGDIVEGPAIVEEDESTIVIGPNGKAIVDEFGNVIMTIAHIGR